MNQEVESYIQKNCPWAKLPPNVKQVMLENNSKGFDRCDDISFLNSCWVDPIKNMINVLLYTALKTSSVTKEIWVIEVTV